MSTDHLNTGDDIIVNPFRRDVAVEGLMPLALRDELPSPATVWFSADAAQWAEGATSADIFTLADEVALMLAIGHQYVQVRGANGRVLYEDW